MAKKKKVVSQAVCDTESGCNWSSKEWLGVVVSEVALFGFLYYALMLLNVQGNLWTSSLILLVLLNIMFFACPVFRKHYL